MLGKLKEVNEIKERKIMHDNVIGNLTYEYGWTRDYSVPFFGTLVNVRLFVPCDEGDEIEDAQRSAFAKFDAKKDLYSHQAEVAIFNYYLDICDEYRDRFGAGLADKLAPHVAVLDDIKALIQPSEVIIRESFNSENRIVGLLFTCSWEPELGLAVKFVNELIDEVGTQDIVL